MSSPYITLPEFKYLRPKTLDEALAILDRYGEDAKIMAGGVALLSFMKERLIEAKYVVDIKGVRELHYIRYSEGDGLRIGATVTFSEIEDYILQRGLVQRFRALYQGIKKLSDPVLRNRSTLAGNVVEALPIVDGPCLLSVFDSELKIVSSSGSRVVSVSEFISDEGFIDLKPNEIVVEIHIKDPPKGFVSTFRKYNPVTEFSMVSVGMSAIREGGRDLRDVRCVLCAATPKPVRLRRFEDLVSRVSDLRSSIDELLSSVESEAAGFIQDDPYASREFKLHIAKMLILDSLKELRSL